MYECREHSQTRYNGKKRSKDFLRYKPGYAFSEGLSNHNAMLKENHETKARVKPKYLALIQIQVYKMDRAEKREPHEPS
jgi:hypothetical protein